MEQDQHRLLQEKYHGVMTPEFELDKKRIENGEPLAYVIGYVPFLDCTIYLDSRPLIPRPETEFWVEQAIDALRKHGTAKLRVLDLCAGSGAIGVAVAKAIPNAEISFVEIDKAHLSSIAKNLDMNDVPCTRYQIFASDLFENAFGKFDFILSNPPYIDPTLNRAARSVTNYEPHLALYGGSDGLELIKRIISDATNYLANAGELWIEHEPEQTAAIHQHAYACNFRIETKKDQYGSERFSVFYQNP